MYLVKGMAVLAMGLAVAGCNKLDFSNQAQISEEEALENAEMQLGGTIDPNQDWKMTKDVQGTVSVNLGTGKEYTLLMFDKNPFVNDDAVYYFKQTITDGSNGTYKLAVPSAQKQLYVTVIDDNDYSVSKYVFFNDDNAFTANLSTEAKAPAMRRANTGVTYNETSTGINANANEWADAADAPHGHGGWKVPDPLTEAQKEIVRKYFQAVPNLGYEDPHFRHFFVQQVYKGGTSAPTTGNKEDNVAADGTTHYSSSNMNLLTVGYNEQHINNFNNGTYSGSGMNTYEGAVNQDGTVNVLDNGHTVNEFADNHHPDQIMLMVNIDDTECMGYHNTGSSLQQNSKAGLVGWETIRTWARQNNLYTEDILNDGWNRSFVGFDFELYSLEQSYLKDNDGNKVYAQFTDGQKSGLQYIWTGTKILKKATQSAPRRSSKAQRRAYVYNGGTIFIKAGMQYNDGDFIYMYNGDNVVGKLIFHGTGSAATANTALSNHGCSAVVERPYFIFKPLIEGSNSQFHVYNSTNNGKLIVLDETTNTIVTSTQWYNTNGYTTGIEGGHTYKLYCENGADLDLYGVFYYNYGNTIADDGSGNNVTEANNAQTGGTEDNNENNNNNNENTQTQTDDELDTYTGGNYLVVNGNQIPFLSTNTNMYGGTKRTISDDDMQITKDGRTCFNMEKIAELVDSGYLPVKDKNLREWVKWQGGDGYYSDWIVTLTEAQRQPEVHVDTTKIEQRPTTWCYAFEDTKNGDYDMNDVVLKVKENGEYLDVWLVAAGATLDLEVRLYAYDANNAAGNYYGSTYQTLEYNNATEIHEMWDVEHGTMVNTGKGANATPIRIAQLAKSDGYEADKLRFTIKSATWEVFLAGSGQAPYGVMIPMDWKWPTERTRITKAYNKTNSGETEADQSFTNFMSNAGHAELWYKYPTGSVTIVNIPE